MDASHGKLRLSKCRMATFLKTGEREGPKHTIPNEPIADEINAEHKIQF
jgi:hypothetical protein